MWIYPEDEPRTLLTVTQPKAMPTTSVTVVTSCCFPPWILTEMRALVERVGKTQQDDLPPSHLPWDRD